MELYMVSLWIVFGYYRNKQAIQDKYCIRGAEWGVGDCSAEGMTPQEKDEFITALKKKAGIEWEFSDVVILFVDWVVLSLSIDYMKNVYTRLNYL